MNTVVTPATLADALHAATPALRSHLEAIYDPDGAESPAWPLMVHEVAALHDWACESSTHLASLLIALVSLVTNSCDADGGTPDAVLDALLARIEAALAAVG